MILKLLLTIKIIAPKALIKTQNYPPATTPAAL